MIEEWIWNDAGIGSVFTNFIQAPKKIFLLKKEYIRQYLQQRMEKHLALILIFFGVKIIIFY